MPSETSHRCAALGVTCYILWEKRDAQVVFLGLSMVLMIVVVADLKEFSVELGTWPAYGSPRTSQGVRAGPT